MNKLIKALLLSAVILLGMGLILVNLHFNYPHAYLKSSYHKWQQAYTTKITAHQTTITNDAKHSSSISEALGYGMYLAVLANNKHLACQQDFEKLVNYYRNHRVIIAHKKTALMQWSQKKTRHGWISENHSASDGDVWIAYALLLAAKQFHEQRYANYAHQLINDIAKYEVNRTTNCLCVGEWANQQSPYYYLMRTSDVLPACFDAFYQATGDRTWNNVKNTMLTRLAASSDKKTGLCPDFVWANKTTTVKTTSNLLKNTHANAYNYNACRIPLNLALSSSTKNTRTQTHLLHFFAQKPIITAGYHLNGTALNHYQSASFGAPIIVATANQAQWHNLNQKQRYIFAQPLQTNNYYPATLTMIAALLTIN